MALYGASEPIDPNDGAALRIIDSNGNGLIDSDEFRDATGGGGLGLNSGSQQLLFDGSPPKNDWTGTLYSPSAVSGGSDVTTYMEQTVKNFSPVSPDNIEDIDGSSSPDGSPLGPDPVCFTPGTMILTPQGERPVETLCPGDLVITLDNGPQPLRWMMSRRSTAALLRTKPWLRPVRIAADALAPGVPHTEFMLSPQHRVMLASPIVRRMYPDDGEVLVPAKKLAEFQGIDVPGCPASNGQGQGAPPGHLPAVGDITYIHLLFDRHEVVLANGAPVETLLTGPVALRSLGADARREVEALFLVSADGPHHPSPARPIPSGRRLRRLLDRHRKNGRPLCADFAGVDAKFTVTSATA